jgi:hypothetical protein
MSTQSLESKLYSFLRKTAKDRKAQTVTADDVHRFVQKNNLNISKGAQTALTNRVFNQPMFIPVAYVQSRRPEARGRYITEWLFNG